MRIVVDASVIVAVIANEPEKSALIELTQGADLIAPNSIHWEIGNALSAMLKRKRITLDQARQAVRAYEEIPIEFVDIEMDQSIQIADALGIYAYDAYLIQCALKHRCPLLSLDQNLIRNAQHEQAQVLEVSK
ncbi:MAG: type II toxin-antitoxin system VapC family toxin [Chloroflexi bacterium]|nr:type II toxin-antitoxin system VapC family toxin [Chloroflexota bacterium]